LIVRLPYVYCSSPMAKLLVIGNPLLDISTHVPADFLAKYDLKSGNAILAEEKHQPIYGEIVKGEVDYIAGGAAQNSARVAQWFLDSNSVAYIGCIGDDVNGATLKKVTSAAGVTTHYLVDEKVPTGVCAVLITDKERSLVTNLGAANHYKLAHFESPAIQQVVHTAQYFYSTGYFITVSTETLVALGQHAAEHNKPFLFNLSAPFVIQFFYDQLSQVLPYTDVVFSNEDEARTFGEKLGWGADLKVIAQRLSTLNKVNGKRSRTVVFTQGSHPTVVAFEGKVTEYPVPPVPAAEIVDTNGAGDSFVGGFLAAYVNGRDLAKCVAAGHYAASEVIRRSGCSLPPRPNFEI